MFYKLFTTSGVKLLNLSHVRSVTCSKNVISFNYSPAITCSFLYIGPTAQCETLTYTLEETAEHVFKEIQEFIEERQRLQ